MEVEAWLRKRKQFIEENDHMAKTITVDIQDGKTTIETRGYTGKACMDATAELEKALGTRTSDKKTPEFETRHVQSQGS